MKKRWFVLIAIVAILSSMFFIGWLLLFSNPKGDYDEIHYHFPKDFSGCGYIIYNVEGARALEVNEKRQLHHYFNEEGVSLTSSPQQFGWANEETSGSYMPFYYIGGQLISLDNELNIVSAVGSGEFPEGGYVEYEFHAFDDNQNCGGVIQNEIFEKYKDRLMTK